MGTKGNRKIRCAEKPEEPKLLSQVDDLIRIAREENCYDGKILNLHKLIDVINTKNQFVDKIKLEYILMEPSISGSLSFRNGVYVISINSNHNPKRQRFTIAHELAHFFLHKDKNTSFTDTILFRNSEIQSSIEFAANDFAGRLLMNEIELRQNINNGVKKLCDLATSFGVSIGAIRFRILQLGYKIKQ